MVGKYLVQLARTRIIGCKSRFYSSQKPKGLSPEKILTHLITVTTGPIHNVCSSFRRRTTFQFFTLVHPVVPYRLAAPVRSPDCQMLKYA